MDIRLLCLLILCLTTLGCKREDPNPEMRDPIYIDLISERRVLGQIQEESIKKIEAAEKELEKSLTRTMERKNIANDLQKERIRLQKSVELIEYFDIRIKERYATTRRSYREAFRADLPWPDPSEHEAYKVNKRLVHASKNWNDRVPRSKMQQNIQNQLPPTAEKTPGETAGEAPPK